MVREALTELKRKRLERTFEVAKTKAAGATTANDFSYVCDLLGQCAAGDPSNPIYIRAFIESLQKKYGNPKKISPLAQFKERAARSAVKKALAQEQWDEVVKEGLKVLAVNPWDLPALTAMAKAAAKSGDNDCEASYLKAALMGTPKDLTCNRLMALAMTERGLIDQAITWWHRVEEIRPNDDEARRSIAALTVEKARASGKFDDDDDVARKTRIKAQQQEELTIEQRLRRQIQSEPEKTANYLELAQFYINDERFRDADPLLAKAFELSDGDADIRDKWQECQLRFLRQEIGGTKDPETKKKLQQEYFEKDVEFYRNQAERYPNDLRIKYELGYRYMKTKRYDEAIRELQTAKNDPRRKGVCLLVLGECFQQIKQYRLAMSHFESAIQEIPERDGENRKNAIYQAGRLALALKDIEAAGKHLTALAGQDFTYKDVSKLLDKLAKLRENLESGQTRHSGVAGPAEDPTN
jgi:tetratricopeptide (TPR) repeat protein